MDSQEHTPRLLMSTRPPGRDIFEVLVTGKDAIGTLNGITEVLKKRNVNFVAAHGHTDESGTKFVNAFFCEMAGATCTPDELQKELEAFPFVDSVMVSQMGRAMFEKFMFPLAMLHAGRALLVDASAFAMVEGRLAQMFGTAGNTMAFEQGKAYAKQLVADSDAYRAKVGSGWDVENIEGCLRAQGWGLVSVEEKADGYEVSVKSPAVLQAGVHGDELGRFFIGIVVGLLEVRARAQLRVDAVRFDPETAAYTFAVSGRKSG